ncbi:TolC family protein [Paraburkholderia sp. MMS20-SJTN17]|uniref:TolC family protein n=1 Tax=Paraburkholderia translucens TaxID=2886945 RepID=A0ABS8KH28_9BURK|nr:TolC family protein [Paraburkholderia sp. MMS20-SJTN17]MCC8404045.1 TolC family protein [Paraburkholderia sp. MMS20-SJTN17]
MFPSPTPCRTTRRLPRRDRLAGRRAAATLSTSLALALAACATPVMQPSVDVPGRFAAASASVEEPEAAWWDSYGDPVLSDLERRAAHQNRDVQIAAERVRAARAGETISRSWLLPTVVIGANGFNHTTTYDTALKNFVPEAANTRAGQVGIGASWEVDLFGRLRAGAKASAADALAVEHSARGVRLLVLTDVATNYFTLVGALRQLDTVRAIAAAQDETLRLVRARERVGLATPFDVERAQTEASRTHAAIPPLETLAEVSRHRIAVLIGDQAFDAGSIVPSGVEAVVPPAHPGQPAELLQRRPDLLAAAAQLDAANARRQQAMAEWFPRLILGAVFGRESIDLNGVALGPATFSNVAGLIAMPIFNAGRTRAINEIAASGQREAVLHYEDAIVRALEDVENALVALGDERQRTQLLHDASGTAEAALGRAQSLYDRGQIDLLPLLDAQRTRLAVRALANDSSTQLLLDSVQLYKALGGGWQVFETAAAPDGASASGTSSNLNPAGGPS